MSLLQIITDVLKENGLSKLILLYLVDPVLDLSMPFDKDVFEHWLSNFDLKYIDHSGNESKTDTDIHLCTKHCHSSHTKYISSWPNWPPCPSGIKIILPEARVDIVRYFGEDFYCVLMFQNLIHLRSIFQRICDTIKEKFTLYKVDFEQFCMPNGLVTVTGAPYTWEDNLAIVLNPGKICRTKLKSNREVGKMTIWISTAKYNKETGYSHYSAYSLASEIFEFSSSDESSDAQVH